MAAVLAATGAMAAYGAGLAAHRTYPFGPHSRAMNDLRNQYVPFHAQLWDLMHGSARGDLFLNWQSGFGVGFLSDFFTYLANPFSWLTGLFPRGRVDFPVFLVTLLSIGLAAGLMTVFLGRLRPGPAWMRALLGVGYALCGWSVVDGAIVPMWMWGLCALPMTGIAADWCLHERRWVSGTLLVALSWFGNFYTAAMATLGTALVLALRLLLAGPDRRVLGRVLWRAVTMAGTGVALAAPAVFVSGLGAREAIPSDLYVHNPGTGVLRYLGQFLPAASTLPPGPQPNVYAGVLALLLVLTLPFMRRIPVRDRAAWLVLIVLTALSFVWLPTAKLWQGFTIPHGDPYRETFVLSGILVMAAWITLARRPGPRPLLGGAAVLAVITAVCAAGLTMPSCTWIAVTVGGAATLAALLLLARPAASRARASVAALLAATTLATSGYAVHGLTVLRDPARLGPAHTTTVSALSRAGARAVAAADAWPATRTDVGPDFTSNDNDPLLVGGEGGQYYSSYVATVTAQTFQALGLGWTLEGRHTGTAVDPVARVIFGVGHTLTTTGHGGVAADTLPVAPLVTVHPDDSDRGAPAGSVWAVRQRLLGARVYQVPDLAPDQALRPGPAGWTLPADPAGRHWTRFTATCAPGTEAYLFAPWYGGRYAALGTSAASRGRRPVRGMPVRRLGTVPATGSFTVAFDAPRPGQTLPAHPVGCLDHRALDAATAHLRTTGATRVTAGGHTLSAVLPAGSTGTAVVAATAITGWTCSTDGGPAHAPVPYLGLIGVPLGSGAHRLSCSYTPPGLRTGLAVSAAAALALAAVLVTARRRRRPVSDVPGGRGALLGMRLRPRGGVGGGASPPSP